MSLPSRSCRAAAAAAVTLAALALHAPDARAQARVPRGTSSQPTVTVSLTAGGRRLDATGPGSCQHASQASIYGVPAAVWTAQLAPASGPSVLLTLWRPSSAGGASQFNLSLGGAGTTHTIATVKGGTVTGNGKVSLAPKGDGGEFTIDGTTAKGVAIRGTVLCSRFTPLVAEGG